MNISVHIERLIFDGVPITSDQRDSVHAAVETELTRLLTAKGFDYSSGYAVPHLTASPIHLAPAIKPWSVGHQIAKAIYGSLTPAAVASRGGSHFSRGQRG
jgi:hypothetical protein